MKIATVSLQTPIALDECVWVRLGVGGGSTAFCKIVVEIVMHLTHSLSWPLNFGLNHVH